MNTTDVPTKETKPFYLTSEFWGSVFGLIFFLGDLLGGWNVVSDNVAGGTVAAIIAGYAIARGNAKSGVPFAETFRK